MTDPGPRLEDTQRVWAHIPPQARFVVLALEHRISRLEKELEKADEENRFLRRELGQRAGRRRRTGRY